jgi:hypothetical protein
VADGEVPRKNKRKHEGRISNPVQGKNSEAGGSSRGEQPVRKKTRSEGPVGDSDAEIITLREEDDERTPSPRAAPAAEVASAPSPAVQSQAVPSPWDPLFNPELFLEKMVDMAGNSSRFNTTPTDELLKMALGHELKGLLLNYALATHQRSEVATAKENEAIIDKNLASIEHDVCATKEKLKGEMEALKADYEEKVSKLVKAHEEELAKAKKDQ